MIEPIKLRTYMSRAYLKARQSPDPSSQNGAILITMREHTPCVLVNGYNHFYDGIPPIVDDRDTKLENIEHAERDALFLAAKRGFRTQGSILICPWQACTECARAIIGCGVGAIVIHKERCDLTDPRWLPKVNKAMGWLRDSGVWIHELEGPISADPILISGRLWSPEHLEFVE